MTPLIQRFRHDPANGVYGDCFPAVLAMLLNLRLDDVPHHHREFADGEQTRFYNEWLKVRGLMIFGCGWPCPVEEIQAFAAEQWPDVHYILSGFSPRDADHAVVGINGIVRADPHPDGGGIIGPGSDGLVWVQMLAVRL